MTFKPVGIDEDSLFPPRVEARLTATFARQISGRMATFGDSIMDLDSYNSDESYGSGTNQAGFISYANAKVGAPFKLVHNGGGPGEQTDLWPARLPDLLASSPEVVIFGPPTNDIWHGVSIGTIKTRVTGLLSTLIAAGIKRIIVMTALPNVSSSGTMNTVRKSYNAWIAQYVRSFPQLTIFDPQRWVEDPSTSSGWVAGYSTDGTHPNEAGGQKIGDALALLLKSIAPAQPPLWTSSSDPTNYLVNGIPVGSSGVKGDASITGTVCNNWTIDLISGTGNAAAASMVFRTDGLQGKINRVVMSGGPGDYRFRQEIASAALAPGKIVYADIECAAGGDWVSPVALMATLEFWSSGSTIISSVPINYLPSTASPLAVSPSGTFRLRSPGVTVPPTATNTKLKIRFAAAAGTFDFCGAAIRDALAVGPI